jgi:hypothetical protein
LSPDTIPRIDGDDASQVLLGHVTWQRPREDSGELYIMVVHNKSHRPPGMLVLGPVADSDRVAITSSGTLKDAADRYPWLHGAAGAETGGGYVAADAIGVSDLGVSPVTFAVVLQPDDVTTGGLLKRATAPAEPGDLTVGLVQVNKHGRVSWAQRLLN